MKKLIVVFIVSLAFTSACYAAPQYQGVGSVAMDSSTVNGGFGLTGYSRAQLRLTTPADIHAIVYCSDCNSGVLCVSTGVLQGAWVSVSSSSVAAAPPCKD